MNKEDWLDYFEAINGRTPSEPEIAQALADGEFQDYTVTDVQEEVVGDDVQVEFHQESSSSASEEAKAESVTITNDEFSQLVSTPQGSTTNQFEPLKENGKNYLVWLLKCLKAPMSDSNENQLTYGLITLAISALFLGAAIINYFHRMLSSLINMTVSGQSIETESPEMYAIFKEAIKNNFGLGKFIIISCFIFLAYFLVAILPTLVEKLAKKSQDSFWAKVGSQLAYVPLLAVVNLFALLASFLTSNKLVLSEGYMSSVVSSFSNFASENPISGVVSTLNLVKEVPAIKSVQTVFIYLAILMIIGLLILVVSLVKNINISIASLNNFYVTLLTLFVFFLIIYFLDKTIISSILSSFKGLEESFKEFY